MYEVKRNPSPPYEKMNREFLDERDEVLSACRAELLRETTSLDMSTTATDYIQQLRGYQKLPHLATLAVHNHQKRIWLGTWFGVHSVGIKLLDDVMDGDQAVHPHELLLGSQLTNHAVAELAVELGEGTVTRIIRDDYRVIWRAQLAEKRAPPTDLDSWDTIARVKTGRFLACYGALACLVAKQDATHHRSFCEALGILVMVTDDLRDFAHLEEEKANIGYMLELGTVDRSSLEDYIRSQAMTARAAARAAELAIDPTLLIDSYEVDILDYLIPGIMEHSRRRAV